ncbi:hypothetical protein CVT24_004184 [Panaeolus cyanescens]|uniref:Uncharacterized protein n=1 Tax=Panaeolus cyanescens TaxID=181874 RepID=A0A409YX52_9AGAR|nr:hypothetical protein CVT24_004184 [Panaeolus cyanescens]
MFNAWHPQWKWKVEDRGGRIMRKIKPLTKAKSFPSFIVQRRWSTMTWHVQSLNQRRQCQRDHHILTVSRLTPSPSLSLPLSNGSKSHSQQSHSRPHTVLAPLPNLRPISSAPPLPWLDTVQVKSTFNTNNVLLARTETNPIDGEERREGRGWIPLRHSVFQYTPSLVVTLHHWSWCGVKGLGWNVLRSHVDLLFPVCLALFKPTWLIWSSSKSPTASDTTLANAARSSDHHSTTTSACVTIKSAFQTRLRTSLYLPRNSTPSFLIQRPLTLPSTSHQFPSTDLSV